MNASKRKLETGTLDSWSQPKKSRIDATTVLPKAITSLDLQQLLDFTSSSCLSEISSQFDQIADALLHHFHLVVQRGDSETEFETLELEFYLLKSTCHEDPFTHGADEQKLSGRWYFHRAPRWSADSHRSLTSSTEYRSGSRKGLDLTIGVPATVESPYFSAVSATPNPSQSLLRGGILLRTIRRVSDSKVTSGPSLLVDQVLLHSKVESISELVEEKWGGDTSAFPSTSSSTGTVSLFLRPKPVQSIPKHAVYRSPRIGLDLSHPGTTPSLAHPRVTFLSRPYRYFTRPELLTANGRAHTFLGVLKALRDTGRYGDTINPAALRRDLMRFTGLKEAVVNRYLGDYKAGIDSGNIKSFVGHSGKGASASPSTYLKMMGTLEKLSLEAKTTDQPSESRPEKDF